jgi:cytochrome c
MKKLGLSVVVLVVWTNLAVGASVERGKELFEGQGMGSNGKSCSSCHPGGKKLEWAATYDEAKLVGIINECIKKPLKGKPLPAGSDEMKSLVQYIRTFAGM